MQKTIVKLANKWIFQFHKKQRALPPIDAAYIAGFKRAMDISLRVCLNPPKDFGNAKTDALSWAYAKIASSVED